MNPRKTQNTRSRAFTLLELLIATAIFATVLVAINTVFYAALRLESKTTKLVQEGLPLNRASLFLKRDFENILPPGGTMVGEFISGVVSNVVADPQGSLEFYTSTGTLEDSHPWGDIQRVAYLLMDPTNRVSTRGRDLVRLVTRNLVPTAFQELPEEQRLMSGVERLDFYFYDGTAWMDSWDSSSAETVLPTAVKLRMELAAQDDSRQQREPPVQFVIPINVQKLTNATESASSGDETGGGSA